MDVNHHGNVMAFNIFCSGAHMIRIQLECCHSATVVFFFQNTNGTLLGPTGLHQPSIAIRYLVFIITRSPPTSRMFKGLVATKYATCHLDDSMLSIISYA